MSVCDWILNIKNEIIKVKIKRQGDNQDETCNGTNADDRRYQP